MKSLLAAVASCLVLLEFIAVPALLLPWALAAPVARMTAAQKIAQVLNQVQSVPNAGPLLVGVSKVDGSLPIGVPLAGYNHGARRVKNWPIPDPKDYTFWMTPSVGIMDPLWIRAVAIDDGQGGDATIILSIDAVGCDKHTFELGLQIAQSQGLKTPVNNIFMSASHSHSMPGATSPQRLWEVAPATDLNIPSLHEQLASSIAAAMVEAESSMRPALIALGDTQLRGVSRNRRARISPYVCSDSVDTQLGVIRIDDAATGTSLATIWQFAIHGVCYGPSNLLASGDILGKASEYIEKLTDGAFAVYLQGAAGDADPANGACDNAPEFAGAATMAQAVAQTREALKPKLSASIHVSVASHYVDFGKTQMNLTLARIENCTSGGPLDICSICKVLDCDANLHLGPDWIDQVPRFVALRIDAAGEHNVIVTMPGEPLFELGNWVRADMGQLGFNRTYLSGYSNSHMGYFAPPDEYQVGGYESQLTLWGIDTALTVRSGVYGVASQLKP